MVMFLRCPWGSWTWQSLTFSCLSSWACYTLQESLSSMTSRVKDRKRGIGSSISSSWDVHSSFRWSADSTISKEALQSGYQLLNFTSYS